MKESHSESLASHTGPESCGVTRKRDAEALIGESAGQVTESRKPRNSEDADSLAWGRKATSCTPITQGVRESRAVEDPGTHGHTQTGTGISRVLPERGKCRDVSGSPRTQDR